MSATSGSGKLRRLFGALALVSMFGSCASADPVSSQPAVDDTAPVDLSFREFYRMPVGPRGLEPTDKLLALDGRRVRIEGYVVQEEEPLPGLFMMAPVPVALAELADGPADYLPGTTVFVHLRSDDAKRKYLSFRAGLWTVVGTLELGGREEPNGRHSFVRLVVDEVSDVRDSTGQVLVLRPDAPAQHRHSY
jgi:hypothetical protein